MFRRILLTLFLGLVAVSTAADEPFTLTYLDHVRDQIPLSDGTQVIVGERGPVDGDCARTTRALVTRRAADGSVLWSRIAQADPTGDLDADRLFVGPGSPDPTTILGSSARAVGRDPVSGSIVVVGELIQVTGDPMSARRVGFVLFLGIDGTLIQGGTVGEPFDPDPPSPVAPTCEDLCARLQETTGSSHRPLGVTFDSQGHLIVTGSRRQPDGSEQAFLAALSPQLDLLWETALSDGRPGEGRDVVVAAGEDGVDTIYVTGALGGLDRDVVVESYDPSGDRLASVLASGERNDSGDEIRLTEDGPVIFGRFNRLLRFGDRTLDGGDCERRFRAHFDRHLQLLEVQVMENNGASELVRRDFRDPVARAGRAPSTAPELLWIQTLKGTWTGGGICQLESSDDSYFSIAGEQGAEFQSDAAFIAAFLIHPAAPTLTQITFELSSQFCTGVTLSLGTGHPESPFFPVGSGFLCPKGEPVVTVPVPFAVSEALGFGGDGTAAEQGLPLLLKVELSFFGYALCGTGLCASGAKDGSVDELDLETDDGR